MTNILPKTSIPAFTSVAQIREWRQAAQRENKAVGFVPTMGALHEGHLSLVHRSILDNDYTVVSIFINPAQFAPHEDLGTYPRSLPQDLKLLETISPPVSAVFVPSVRDMYPLGITQVVDEQKGTFVEVKGYSHQMEGASRPTFFRGVATVVTKLLNVVQPSIGQQPTHAYFGQKDIQQGLLLRRLVGDLLMSHPIPENLHIVPTYRSEADGLAFSSRNAYLSPSQRELANTLYLALKGGEEAWRDGAGKEGTLGRCYEVISAKRTEAESQGIEMRLDYVSMNDPYTLGDVGEDARESDGKPVILSGALWLGKTRLIDNIILGDSSKILR